MKHICVPGIILRILYKLPQLTFTVLHEGALVIPMRYWEGLGLCWDPKLLMETHGVEFFGSLRWGSFGTAPAGNEGGLRQSGVPRASPSPLNAFPPAYTPLR